MKIQKYIFLLFLWVITISIIIIFWGTGRLFIVFPSLFTTIGYFLLVQGLEGKKKTKNLTPMNLSNLKEGVAKLEGSIESIETMKSPINNEPSVYYDIVIENGEINYADVEFYEKDIRTGSSEKNIVKAKWSVVGRKSEWKEFYLENDNGRILVKNPEYAEGNWIFSKDTCNKIETTEFINAPENIQAIVKDFMEKKKKKIEDRRIIRYLERVIKTGDNAIVYGNIEKKDNEYCVSNSKDGIFFITNDKKFDLEEFEHRNYLKGLIIFIIGIIGMIVAFFWVNIV
jgi:preprotein translocase subunit Sss1